MACPILVCRYLNPTLLFPDKKTGRRGASEVTKSGEAAWSKWCTAWYEQFDLTFTGFLINGDQGPLTAEALAMYDSFSPDGVVVTTGHDPVDNDANGKKESYIASASAVRGP